MRTDIKVSGIAELDARIGELDALAGKKILRRAVRRSVIKLEKSASANAKGIARSGALAQSVRIANVRPRDNETVAVQVGPKKKDRKAISLRNAHYKRKDKGIFYGHLVEFGHRVGTRRTGWLRKLNRAFGKGGSSKRRVEGRAWFRPAWDATRSGIVPEFERILRNAIKRIERRRGKRTVEAEGLVEP